MHTFLPSSAGCIEADAAFIYSVFEKQKDLVLQPWCMALFSSH
jgi:hypothetical protein